MKTSKQLKAVEKSSVRSHYLLWKITAVCLPVMIAVALLLGARFNKEKRAIQDHSYEWFDVREMALFVAMPLLNAISK